MIRDKLSIVYGDYHCKQCGRTPNNCMCHGESPLLKLLPILHKIQKESKLMKELQQQVKEWTEHNFPNTPKHRPLIGVMEELGEISHSILKMEQGIRNNQPHREKLIDGIGDLTIYLIDLCNKYEIDYGKAIWDTWNEVKKRDWIKFPNNGVDN